MYLYLMRCWKLIWLASVVFVFMFPVFTQSDITSGDFLTYIDVSRIFEEKCVMCHSGENAPQCMHKVLPLQKTILSQLMSCSAIACCLSLNMDSFLVDSTLASKIAGGRKPMSVYQAKK